LTVTLLGLLVSGTLEVQAQAYVPIMPLWDVFHISGQYTTSGRQHSRTSVVYDIFRRYHRFSRNFFPFSLIGFVGVPLSIQLLSEKERVSAEVTRFFRRFVEKRSAAL